MIEIKHRWNGTAVFRSETATTLREAVLQAIGFRAELTGADLTGADLTDADLTDAYLTGAYLAGADLTDAYLTGADLTGADLTGADLTGAYLTGAYLTDADLTDADLAGAYLTGAYLAGAYLTGAYLAGADLTDADLAGAYLTGAYLAGAYLTGAYLTGAYLTGAYLNDARNLPVGVNATSPVEPYVRCTTPNDFTARAARYRERHPEIPVVEKLDLKIAEVLDAGKGTLNMREWHSHSCETTHCRAGWAITLAGDAGKALETQHGPQRAGSMIYRASTGRVPHFFASNEDAMADINARAEEQKTWT